jgi:hypothetical protein
MRNKIKIIAGLAASHFLAIFLTATIVMAAFTSYNLYLTALPHSDDYTIESDGAGNVRAIKYDGSTPYSGTDLGNIVNTIIGSGLTYTQRKALAPLSVKVMGGNYTVTEKILINRKHLQIDFGFSSFYSSLLPFLEVDGHEFVWDSTEPNLNDLVIMNFHAQYTGSVMDGAFVYVHDVHHSRQYPASGEDQYGGGLEFSNWDLTGKFRYNDYAFTGLKIGATEGAHFSHITGQRFGSGIWIVYIAPWQASHNVFDLVFWRETNYGVIYDGSASVTNDVWNSPKLMNTGNSAFALKAEIAGVLITDLQVEGYYGYGLESNAMSVTVINPLFSSSGGVGNAGEGRYAIYLPTGSVQHYASIVNPQIYGTPTGIYSRVDTTISGLYTLSVTTPLDISGAVIHGLEAHGSGAYATGAWVAYGFSYGVTPSSITLTPRSNVAVWVSARNSTHFQVGVSAGTPTIDWIAEV